MGVLLDMSAHLMASNHCLIDRPRMRVLFLQSCLSIAAVSAVIMQKSHIFYHKRYMFDVIFSPTHLHTSAVLLI